MREEFKKAYIRHTLGSGVMHYEEEKVNEGLEKLNELITTASEIKDSNTTIFADFRKIDRFYGFVQGGNLSEDNLFYDLNIESEPDANTEQLDKIIDPRLLEVHELLNDLKTDIENTVAAIKGYNSGDKSAEELANLVEKISLDDDYARLYNPEKAATTPNGAAVGAGIGASAGIVSSNGSGRKKATTYTPTKTATATPVNNVKKTETPILSQTDSEPARTYPGTPAPTSTPTPSIAEKEDTQKVDIPKPTPNTDKTSEDKIIQDFTDSSTNTKPTKPNIPTSTTTKINTTPISTSIKDVLNPTAKDKSDTIKSIQDVLKEETKNIDNGSLVSSINNVKNKNDTLLKPIPTATITNEETTPVGKFVPPIAGIATAGATGIGTKIYLDKKDKDDNNKEENKFFNYDQFEEENEDDSILEESTPLSKEDLLEVLDGDDTFKDINNI